MRNVLTRLIKAMALFVLALALSGFVACKPAEKPQWVNKAKTLETEYEQYETFVGGFEYDIVTVIVEYLNGETEEFSLTEDMLSETDRAKQNQIGEHTLTVTYNNLSCTFDLIVLEDTSEYIEFSDKETVYNGVAQYLSVENLPVGATVEYENNGQINVGEYEVRATVTLPGGREKAMAATLTVVKAPLTVKANVAKTFVNYQPEFSYELVGLVGNDDETALSALPRLIAGTQVETIGVYENYVKYEGASAQNYEITYENADFVILAMPQIQTENGKKYLTLGEYPQSVVSNAQTIATLDEKIDSGALVADSKGYYTLNGVSYVKMTSNHYVNGESYAKFTNGETIIYGKSYYFMVEPIRWQVLSETNGIVLIAEKLLDTQPFWDIDNAIEIAGVTYNPNDYSQSEIRKWLNGEFRNIAFGAHERALMNKVTVSNGVEEGLYPDYPCADTQDYVYLPSYKDITNVNYGFSANDSRMALTTDYTRATGTYMRPALSTDPEQIGYGQYYLRSAGFSGIREVSVVDCFGNPTKEAQSGSFIVCVRPMISVTLSA
ncbi:MAG: hypothetical protein IJX75_05485 [Clostridia bacterium]|nr:hypothetical protein [Clostridia bacterium]